MVVTEEDDAGSKERTLWVPNTARKDKPEQCEQQSCGQGHHQTDRVTSRDERANHIDVDAGHAGVHHQAGPSRVPHGAVAW